MAIFMGVIRIHIRKGNLRVFIIAEIKYRNSCLKTKKKLLIKTRKK